MLKQFNKRNYYQITHRRRGEDRERDGVTILVIVWEEIEWEDEERRTATDERTKENYRLVKFSKWYGYKRRRTWRTVETKRAIQVQELVFGLLSTWKWRHYKNNAFIFTSTCDVKTSQATVDDQIVKWSWASCYPPCTTISSKAFSHQHTRSRPSIEPKKLVVPRRYVSTVQILPII